MRKNLLLVAAACLLLPLAGWALVTAESDEEYPQDKTSLITNPQFDDGKTGWSGNFGNGAQKGLSSNKVITSFGGSFNVYQDLEGLEPGVYKLQVQAFSRPVSNVDTWADYKAGKELENLTYVYANEVEKKVPLIVENYMTEPQTVGAWTTLETGKYIPDNSDAFSIAFSAGLYENELEVVVGSEGTLRIGVRNEATSGTTYAGYDNFRLTYYGPLTTVTEEQVAELLAMVPEGKMNAALQAALDKAVEDLKAEASADNYMTLQELVPEAKASIAAYAAVKAALDAAAATELGDEAQAQYDAEVADIVSGYEAGTLTGDGVAEVEAIEAAIAAAIRTDLKNQSDKTALIVNPQFNDGKSGWSGDFGNGEKKGLESNYVITSYGGSFNIYQDIEGLEPGVYKLQVQAFSRPKSNVDTWADYKAGVELENLTYIYANDVDKLVPLIVEDYMTEPQTVGNWTTLETGKYIPDNSNAFSIAFSAGLYENELMVIVGEEGTLRIGVRNEATSSITYAGYDNFRLTYLGAIDQTAKIVNPQFDDTPDGTGWTVNEGKIEVKARGAGNPVVTAYGYAFDVCQTITGLHAGNYKLKVQAFSRPKSNVDTWADYKAGKDVENLTYIYANGAEEVSKKVPLIVEEYLSEKPATGSWSELEAGMFIPNNSDAFAVAFSSEMYENELVVPVGEDGTLTIGIRNESTGKESYAGYDNFRLEYTLDDVVDPSQMYLDALALIEKYETIAGQAAEHDAFDAVVAAAKATLQEQTATSKQVEDLKAEVLAALKDVLTAGKTETGQFDLTGLIANPSFDTGTSGWKTDNGNLNWRSAGVAQMINVQNGENIYQVLEGMPAGKYTLKVQGFYRAQGWKKAVYYYENGEEDNKLSFYLNDNVKQMKSLFDDTRFGLTPSSVTSEDVFGVVDGSGFANNSTIAAQAFGLGDYWNYMEVELTEDGDITLGVKLDETTMEDNWMIFDNFRLYYGERDTVVLSTTGNYTVNEVTPAPVVLKGLSSGYQAGTLYPFSAPCDIPGDKFKHVYEVGSIDYEAKSVTIYPVEYLRAGVPSFVEFETDVNEIEVGQTVLTPKTVDQAPAIWDGGLIYPYYKTFTWRTMDFSKAQKGAALYTDIKILDLDNMQITANVENYQVRMFVDYIYTQAASSVVANYNVNPPARREIPHGVGIPVPASKAEGAVVKYSLNADMTDARTQPVVGARTICYIPNLVPDNTYYYEVESAGEVVSKGQIEVEGPVRMVYAPSIFNIRDLGGRIVEDGRKVRYGLIYRGGEVNGTHPATAEDLQRMKDLGVAAEVDLRWNDSYDKDRETNISAYGFEHGVDYYFAGANDYLASDVLNEATMKRMKEEFQFILRHVREGKAVHFHCVWGADRTGFLAFLLEGLLGYSLNDMYHDYEFTSFVPSGSGNRLKSSIQERIAVIQGLAGTTLRDKFETYWVKRVGLTQEEVDEFRDIMLVDTTPVGIQNPYTQDAEGAQKEIQAVYNAGGTQVPVSNLNGVSGLYIVKYTDGTSRKVFVK